MPSKIFKKKGGMGIENITNIISSPVPSKKKTIIIIIAVIVVILLIILGIYLYKTYSNKGGTRGKIVDLIPKIHDGKMKKRINQNLIPNSVQGNEYCFNFWIYINDYTYRFHDKKSIMFKGNETDKENSNPGIWLLDKTNIFRVTIGLQTKDPSSEHLESDTPNVDVCDIKDIPLQRWVNINIGLYNNIIDIYINGDLNKSCVLKGFPKLNNDHLHLGNEGGFNGYISKLRVSNTYLSHNKIKKMYLEGPGI
jgi:hypothetical protein